MNSPVESELSLRDYLHVLQRRKRIVALAVFAVVATALTLSFLQTPLYQAKAELLLKPRATDTLFSQNTAQADPTRALNTEIHVLESAPVRDAVKAKLGAAPKVSAGAAGQTDVIEVRATSTDPARAAAIVNGYATAYIEFRRSQDLNDFTAAGHQIQSQVSDLQKQIDALNAQISSAGSKEQSAVLQNVGPQRDALLQQQALFKEKLDQLQVQSAVGNGGAQLVTPAAVPSTPSSPRPVRNAILALAVGLVFGVGVAFLIDYLDDTIKSKADVEQLAHGLPILALIPEVPEWRDREKATVISVSDPGSPAAEAYRGLRTSIQFIGLDRPMRTIQVTSPAAADGKTATVANLGVALAGAGQRTVMLSCDLRRPRLHAFFDRSKQIGFTSVQLGNVPLSAAVQSTEVPNLYLLPSGPEPPNPSELLAGRRTVEVLTTMQATNDVVLVDTPPVLPVTDAAVIASRVDATLLLVRLGATTHKQLHRTLEILAQVHAPVVGIVLNGVKEQSSYDYGYGSASGRYGSAEAVAETSGHPDPWPGVATKN